MPNPTARLGLTKPTIGDTSVWGSQLNTDLDLLDAAVGIVDSVLAVSSNTVLSGANVFVQATSGSGGISVTLPSSSLVAGVTVKVKKMDLTVGVVTITGGTKTCPLFLLFIK